MSSAENPDDIFNIMVASDIHLGYNENDQIRGEDSFVAFEEILQYAVEYDVDFILLGGDLFHDAKPSPSCLLRCTSLLRKYCLGDKPIAVEILSEQSENFNEACVNYEDPNQNVSYPVFSIHGNHDDPIGRSAVGSLDILSRVGLVNYIGKWTSYADVVVTPVLMRKGRTKLALYGLGHLKDRRLARLFADGKVAMEKVSDDDEWFNVLVLHQNRADRGHLNHIREEALPGFVDLVVWGHEHDCRIRPEWNPVKSFHVVQPGSPVATSLAAGESLPKHCGVLQVFGKGFKMAPVRLQTVRPFVFETIVLSEIFADAGVVNEHELVQKYLVESVERALKKADDERSGHPNQPKLPLVRLNVFYERESQQFNAIRFGQQFTDRIANPQDLILLKREKAKERIVRKTDLDMDALDDLVSGYDGEEISVESLIEQYYKEQPDDRKLSMLSVRGLSEAVKNFTQKGHTDAFADLIEYQKEEYLKHLKQSKVEDEAEIKNEIFVCKEMHFSDASAETQKITKFLETASSSPKKKTSRVDSMSNEDDDCEEANGAAESSGTAARGRGGRGRGRGRGAKTKSPPPPKSPPTRARGRGSRGGRNSRATAAKSAAKSPSNGSRSGNLNVSYETSSNASSGNWLTNYSQRASSLQASSNSKASNGNKKTIYISDSDSG